MSRHIIPLRSCRAGGFSYVESIVALMILATALAPALSALRPGLAAAASVRSYSVNQQRLKSRMEEVLANRFAALDAAAIAAGNSPAATVAAYSDAAGTPDRLLVTLYRYDGVSLTASDSGLLWVTVAIEGSSLALNTLKSRW